MVKILKLLGWAITIGATISSIYFYEVSKRERLPTFFVHPAKVKVVSKDFIQSTPLRLSDKNGQQIKENIYSANFYFFNQGKESIKPENVLQTIKISVNDPNAEVLDFKIIKVSRDVINMKLSKDSLSKNVVVPSFRILEKNDGCIGQLIYQSAIDADVKISGVVEGSQDAFLNTVKREFPLTYLSFWFVFILAVVTLPIVVIFLLLRKDTSDTLIKKGDKATKPTNTLGGWLTTPYQMIIRHEDNYQEMTSLSFRYSQIIFFSMALSTGLFLMSLFTAKTVLARWFDPKYVNEIELPESLK